MEQKGDHWQSTRTTWHHLNTLLTFWEYSKKGLHCEFTKYWRFAIVNLYASLKNVLHRFIVLIVCQSVEILPPTLRSTTNSWNPSCEQELRINVNNLFSLQMYSLSENSSCHLLPHSSPNFSVHFAFERQIVLATRFLIIFTTVPELRFWLFFCFGIAQWRNTRGCWRTQAIQASGAIKTLELNVLELRRLKLASLRPTCFYDIFST